VGSVRSGSTGTLAALADTPLTRHGTRAARAALQLRHLAQEPWTRPVARIVGAVVVIVAVAVGWWARRADVELGAATAPLFLIDLPALPETWWQPLLPTALAIVAAVALLAAERRVGPRAFAVLATVLALAARAAVALGQRGTDGWTYGVTRHGARETDYPAAFATVDGGVLRFVDHFAELVPSLPVHPSGHPPGATLLAWTIYQPFGDLEDYGRALLVLGALSTLPVLYLARQLLDDDRARIATLLWAFAPSTLVYGATSFDALLVGIAALAAGLVAGRRFAAGAVATAGGFLISYALPLATIWAVLSLPRRDAVRAAVWTGLATLTTLILLAVLVGYDPLSAVAATHDAYERGIGGRRPQWYWAIGGPAAFLLMLGPVLAERWLRSVELAARGARALVACIALGVASGVMEAEVERLWQFVVPLAAVGAAAVTSRRWAAVAIGAGALQALVVELRWDTTF
jgi:hypothetical protein